MIVCEHGARFEGAPDLAKDRYRKRVVYFIQAGRTGPIKIGYTVEPGPRMAALQCGCWVPLRLRAVVPGGPAGESELHMVFSSSSLGGEWFAPTPDLTSMIDGIVTAQVLCPECPMPDDGQCVTVKDDGIRCRNGRMHDGLLCVSHDRSVRAAESRGVANV